MYFCNKWLICTAVCIFYLQLLAMENLKLRGLIGHLGFLTKKGAQHILDGSDRLKKLLLLEMHTRQVAIFALGMVNQQTTDTHWCVTHSGQPLPYLIWIKNHLCYLCTGLRKGPTLHPVFQCSISVII